MPGNRLFNPKANSIRPPLSNTTDDGMIVNPPRAARMGGLHTVSPRGVARNAFKIQRPGNGRSAHTDKSDNKL